MFSFFQFGSEADKRKIFVGGPWHFVKALIVLTEPVGIGEITKKILLMFHFGFKYSMYLSCA